MIHCITDEKKSVDDENERMRRTPLSKAEFDNFEYKTYSPPAEIDLLDLVRFVWFDGKTLWLETNSDDVASHVREHFDTLAPYLRDTFGDSLEDLQITVIKLKAKDPVSIWAQVKENLVPP